MTGAAPGRDGGDFPEPRPLRRLRLLVTTLTATLILGVIVVVGLLVIRLWSFAPSPPPPALPAGLALPAGETARAATFGTGWVAVVTADAGGRERIRVFDSRTGAARGQADIAPAP